MAELSPQSVKDVYTRITAERGKVMVGQEEIVMLLLVSLFARGHCLLIGVPGLAKTLLVRSLAETLQLSFKGIQFTPDLMPSDIIGSELCRSAIASSRILYVSFMQKHTRPMAVDREMSRVMNPGSVLVDIAIDQGGCAETSRPTTHDDPTFVEEGVIHYCVANMPAAFARTATQALTNVTYRYIELLADHGVPGAFQREPHLASGLNLIDGKVTHPGVAEAHGMELTNPRARL